MAGRRMFSWDVASSDDFLDLPHSAQVLYFHIGLNADDDGFLKRLNSIRRSTQTTDEDVKALVDAGFIHVFPSGVVVDMYWNVNNNVRKDRYHQTVYQEERQQLTMVEGGKYVLNTSDNQCDTECQPSDNQCDTEVGSIGSIGEVGSINHPSINNYSESTNRQPVDNSVGNAEPEANKQQPATLDGWNLYQLDNKNAFELFRKEYPRHQGALRDVQTAWVITTVEHHVLPGDLVMAARNYAAKCKREKVDPKFIKMPHNFLRDGWKEFIPQYLPSCPHCHGQGVYEDGDRMIMCDCDRRYG